MGVVSVVTHGCMRPDAASLVPDQLPGGSMKKLLMTLIVLAALVAIGVKAGVIQIDHPIDA